LIYNHGRYTIHAVKNQKKKTYNLVLEAICAALITICSWISLQVMDIPFTLQTFGVLLVLLSVGGRRGTISVLVYLLLGLVGVPVFSGFKSGPAALSGPTGGFIAGFLMEALIYWLIDSLFLKKLKTTKVRHLVICAIEGVICELVLYIFGVAWFIIMYTQSTGPITVSVVLAKCVIPFLIPDAVKLIAACVASLRTSRIVKES